MPTFRKKTTSVSEQSGVARMENEGGRIARPPASGKNLDETLAEFGIVSSPSTVFEWGGYRYTNAGDAIAAAKRGWSS